MELAQMMEQLAQQWPGAVKALEGKERYELHLTHPARSVELRASGGDVELTMELGPCPSPPSEELLRTLMRGNLMGEGTGGAVLATDPAGARLKMVQSLQVDAYSELLQRLEAFVNYADYWTQALDSQAKGMIKL